MLHNKFTHRYHDWQIGGNYRNDRRKTFKLVFEREAGHLKSKFFIFYWPSLQVNGSASLDGHLARIPHVAVKSQ